MQREPEPGPVVVERRVTPWGELALRRHGDHHEIISNGVFLMSTEDGGSERALVAAALERAPRPRRLLLGGLGVGFSLAQACAHERLEHITVVELEPTIVAWHERYFAPWLGAPLADPRVEVVEADLAAWLAPRSRAYDVVCVDVDNAPDWTVRAGNDDLYTPAGLASLAGALTPDGVLAVWSAHRHDAFERRLASSFTHVDVVEVAATRGPPDVIYLAREPGQLQGAPR